MIKKVISIALSLLALLVVLTFTGCEERNVEVESVFNIEENFYGERIVTLIFPLSIDIEDVSDNIIEEAPDIEGIDFEYVGVLDDGYHFELKITFNSKDDYISKVSSLIGREATVYLSRPDSVLAKGIRMKEDFSLGDLIYWIPRITKNNLETSSLGYKYLGNTISIDGDKYIASSTIDIMQRIGVEIYGITIDTTNYKDDTYDRTITFSIPKDSYDKVETKLYNYFLTNTMPNASFCEWTDKGEIKEYTVIYKGITLKELIVFTARLLDCNNVDAFYGDKDNASTPLSIGNTFEESFDTFSFIGIGNKPIKVNYNYALPADSIHGEGAIKSKGNWKQSGKWNLGVYSTEIDDDIVAVKIPDGTQYSIIGINFKLESLSENSFIRTTELIYDKTEQEGLEYASGYFENLGVDVTVELGEDNNRCKVVCSGTAFEITDQLMKCFGSGNFMSYSLEDGAFSLSSKTQLIDSINIGHMLNDNNSSVPMMYVAFSKGEEKIYSLDCDGNDTVYGVSGSEELFVPITHGEGIITYKGVITNHSAIIVFIIVSIIVIALVIFLVIQFYIPRKIKKKNSKHQVQDGFDYDYEYYDPEKLEFKDAPFQTTMFKVSDIKKLISQNKEDEKIKNQINEEIDKIIDEEIEEKAEDIQKNNNQSDNDQLTEIIDELKGKTKTKSNTEKEDEENMDTHTNDNIVLEKTKEDKIEKEEEEKESE